MIAAIENAILARLADAGESGLLGYRFRSLESYPEDWDAYLKDKRDWKAPAAWVVFTGADEIMELDTGQVRLTAQFGLVVAAENKRNETATRHGGPVASEPGSYQLLIDAVSLLAGADFGLDIDRIEIGVVRQVRPVAALIERNVSMFAIELVTAFGIVQPDSDGDPQPFTAFHANWDVPPFGGIDAAPGTPGIQLPDDVHADAVDHVELPQ